MKLNPFYLISLLLLLNACDYNKDYDFKNLNSKQIEARIIKNKSTKSDIKDLFGVAYDLDFDSNGKEKWTYSYHEKSKNPFYSILLIKILLGKSIIQHKLEIIFDHDTVAAYELTIKAIQS